MSMREAIKIDDPRAADVFRAARQRSILLSLLDEDRSLSELSRLTDTPLNLLHHHLRKLLRLGLVRMTHQKRRAGAPIKFYRAVARRFFVPAELMGALPDTELTARLRARLSESLAGALDGVLFFSDAGRPRMRLVKAAGGARGGHGDVARASTEQRRSRSSRRRAARAAPSLRVQVEELAPSLARPCRAGARLSRARGASVHGIRSQGSLL